MQQMKPKSIPPGFASRTKKRFWQRHPSLIACGPLLALAYFWQAEDGPRLPVPQPTDAYVASELNDSIIPSVLSRGDRALYRDIFAADKAGGPHDAVKGGCLTCHRPHGPDGIASPPACATCHKSAELPGLHTVPAHTACAGCHSSHGPPRPDRATCTGSCHADRKDHEPQATSCAGCHVFRR